MDLLDNKLKQALISQTSCGQPELRSILEQEIDFIWLCQDDRCNTRLRYAHTQLALIELAQIFVRNKIDTSTRNAVVNATEDFTTSGFKKIEAESTATGRSCNWSQATSAHIFNRDSTDNSVSFSESNGQRSAVREETGYDKSCRHTSGHGFHFGRIEHHILDQGGEALGFGLGRELTDAYRISHTGGGTTHLRPLDHPEFNVFFVPSVLPPFFGLDGAPGPIPTVPFPTNSDEICHDIFDDPRLCNLDHQSYGYNYHGKFRISVCLPTFGCMNIEFDRNGSERQYAHCSESSVEGRSETNGTNNREERGTTDARPEDNVTSSRERTDIYHLVRKFGTSTRRGLDTTDAEERAIGRADGTSHSETQRDSSGQAYQQRRAESLTTGQTRSQSTREEHAKAEETKRAFGQISQQLGKLWIRIWDNIHLIEKQQAGSNSAVSLIHCTIPSRCCFSDIISRKDYHGNYLSWIAR